jgi:hypothetical protein
MKPFDLNSAVVVAAVRTGETVIKVPAESWGTASRIAFDSELLDADHPNCPNSDAEGWYPLVYHCAQGEWRGKMIRV